jgi:hypothetical protein
MRDDHRLSDEANEMRHPDRQREAGEEARERRSSESNSEADAPLGRHSDIEPATQQDEKKPVTWSDLPRKEQLIIITIARLSEPLVQTSLQVGYSLRETKLQEPQDWMEYSTLHSLPRPIYTTSSNGSIPPPPTRPSQARLVSSMPASWAPSLRQPCSGAALPTQPTSAAKQSSSSASSAPGCPASGSGSGSRGRPARLAATTASSREPWVR